MERLPSKPPSTDSECAEVFRALGDATRLRVLQVLLECPARVGDLVRRLEVEQSLLSHHLQVLKGCGLVHATRDGKSVVYRVAPEISAAKKGQCLDLVCCQVTFPGPAKKGKASR